MSQSTRTIVGFSLYEKDSWTILLNQNNGYANEQNFFTGTESLDGRMGLGWTECTT
jgi:hypothetical protein